MGLEITYSYARTQYIPNADWCTWTAEHLPEAKDFWVSDIDGYKFDSRGNLMILEKKCFNAEMSYSQNVTYQILDCGIQAGIEATNSVVNVGGKDWHLAYHGFQFVQFSKADFWESSITINGRFFDHCTAIEQLSFSDIFPDGERHWQMTVPGINVIRNRAGDLLLIERISTPNKSLSLPVKILDQLLRAGLRKKVLIKYNGKEFKTRMRYQGAHLLEFIDGQPVRWDGERINSEKLAKILSFGA